MQVGSQAVPGDAAVAGSVGEACERFRRVSGERSGASHVDFVGRSRAVVAGEGEPDLPGDLLAGQHGFDGQQSQSRHRFRVAFDAVRIADGAAHHLITAADARHGASRFGQPDDLVGQPLAAEFRQVGHHAFGPGQEDDVGIVERFGRIGVIEADAGTAFQRIEIGEIREVAQQHDSDVDLPGFGPAVAPVERHGVFGFDMHVAQVGDHAQHGDAAEFFEHPAAFVEEADVAAELVDEDAFDQPAFPRFEQLHRSVHRGEHPSAVDIGHQKHVRPGVGGHRHIHEVRIAQVQFADASGAFEHHGVVARRQTVVGGADLAPQGIPPGPGAEEFGGGAVSGDPAVEDHLTDLVGVGFQQQRVHVRMALHAGGFGLHDLRPAHLAAVGRHIGVQGHVLGLERCGVVSVLAENAAESRGEQAFAHVAARSGEHRRMQSFVSFAHVPLCFGSPPARREPCKKRPSKSDGLFLRVENTIREPIRQSPLLSR